MSDKRDLTGVWYGRWTSANRNVRENSFIAHLAEAHGVVRGSISERNLSGNGILHADVDGARAGGSVQFVKQYDGSGRLNHAVLYRGSVNAEGTEVAGSWHLERYSGGFSMQRESFTEEEIELVEDVAEPVT